MPKHHGQVGLLLILGLGVMALPLLVFKDTAPETVSPVARPPGTVSTAAIVAPATHAKALTLENLMAVVLPDNQGISATLKVRVAMTDGGELQGSLSVTGSVRPDLKTQRFFLAQPTLQLMEIPALPQAEQPEVQAALDRALTRFFQENPIYDPAGTVTSRVFQIPIGGGN